MQKKTDISQIRFEYKKGSIDIKNIDSNPIKQFKKWIKEVIKNENISNVDVDTFEGLLMAYANKKKANIVIRGLRAVSDFEYEFQMTGMNYKLNPKIETIFLMSLDKYQLISSKLIKEINALKGDVSQFVPKIVENKLIKKN